MAMSSISTANHWLWNFVVALVTPVALDTIGWQYYIVFAVIAACIPVSVIFFYPETKGKCTRRCFSDTILLPSYSK